MRDVWLVDDTVNLRAEASLARVRDALARAGTTLFGWRYHYAGGCSRTTIGLETFDEYLQLLDSARPGDHLTLYDFDAVASLALVHITELDTARKWRTCAHLAFLAEDENADAAVVCRAQGAPVEVHELNQPDPAVWDELDLLTQDAEEILVFDITADRNVLDADEQGTPIREVSAGPGRRRVHALADGKCPSAEGLVPTSGPY